MPSQMPGLLLVVLPFLNHAIDMSNETLHLAHCSLHGPQPWALAPSQNSLEIKVPAAHPQGPAVSVS